MTLPNESGRDEPRRTKGNAPSWLAALDQETSRITTALERCESRAARADGEYLRILERIRDQLDAANVVLNEFERRGRLRRRVLAGGVYETVLVRLQAASEDLLLVEDSDSVLARVPGIRAGLKAFIDVDDSRFDSYIQFIDRLVSAQGPSDREPQRRAVRTGTSRTGAVLRRRDRGVNA